MKEKYSNILIAIFMIIMSIWAFYESAKELQETISCHYASSVCTYTKSCPFLTPSFVRKFNLNEIYFEQNKRMVRSSKGRSHTEIDNFIVFGREHLRVSYKVFSKLSEYKQKQTGNLFIQNYQIGIIPLCALFFVLGLCILINTLKKEKN